MAKFSLTLKISGFDSRRGHQQGREASAEGELMSSNCGSLLDLLTGPGVAWEKLWFERRDVRALDW